MHASVFLLCYLTSSHPFTNAVSHTHTHTPHSLLPTPVQKVVVVLVAIYQGPLSPDIVASWCPEDGELDENQEVRSRGIGEGSFLCDSGPFGHYCKGQSSDSWLPLPRPVVN